MLKQNEVLNDLLGFEGMKIIQRKDMLNFSLDSVLLANFVTLNTGIKTIFDIGTGNAPVPLFLSQKTKAKIYGIEIQEESVDLARRSVAINHLEEQIEICHFDVNEVGNFFPHSIADVVVSNPPFFKFSESAIINQNDALTVARHEVRLNLEQLVKQAAFLLKNNGYFAMVHRPDRLIEIIEVLQKYRLEPKRIQFIYPKVGRDAHMLLIEARFNGNVGVKVLPPIYAHNEDGSYSDYVVKCFGKEMQE
ncbi:tRNA1(Val) (adenine(37)-N6)-methyltransferase [Culicoidibacter larvae]|nr:tRNA1(Val) (adenine(37)-N6)-methyltransferase [Culicoidibacter larvae]